MSWEVFLQASADCVEATEGILGYLTTRAEKLDENQGSVSQTKQAQSNGDIWRTRGHLQKRQDNGSISYRSFLLTGHIQVGVGLDLPGFISSETLEDSSVLRTQRLDPQPTTQQDFIAGVFQLAEGNRVLIPDQGGNGNT